MKRESAGVREEVEDAPAARELPHAYAILPLVEERPRLLPAGQVDHERNAVLANRDLVGGRLATKDLQSGGLALAAEAMDEGANAPALHGRPQRRGEIVDPSACALSVAPDHRDRTVAIDDQPGHAVALAVQDSKRVGGVDVEEPIAEVARAPGSRLPEGVVQRLLAGRPDPHRNGRLGVGDAATDGPPVRGHHLHLVPGRRTLEPLGHGFAPDPGVSPDDSLGGRALAQHDFAWRPPRRRCLRSHVFTRFYARLLPGSRRA